MTHDGPSSPDLPVDPDLTPADERDIRVRPRIRPRRWDIALVIAAGGAIGGAARWTMSEAWPTSEQGFPWATFAENVAGCLLLGAVMVFLLDVWAPHRYARPFLGIGVLGGFTTFSAYSLETMRMIERNDWLGASTYSLGSVIAGLAAVGLGLLIAKRVFG